jgi:hypothetical protein
MGRVSEEWESEKVARMRALDESVLIVQLF